jgi:hypothetical protein
VNLNQMNQRVILTIWYLKGKCVHMTIIPDELLRSEKFYKSGHLQARAKFLVPHGRLPSIERRFMAERVFS